MCKFLCNILNKLDPKCTVVLAMIWLPLRQTALLCGFIVLSAMAASLLRIRKCRDF